MVWCLAKRIGSVFLTQPRIYSNTFARTLSTSSARMAPTLPTVPTDAEVEQYKGENHTAFVIGYTGEVGKTLVTALNERKIFSKVVLIGRRKTELSVGPEFEQRVIDFEKPEDHAEAVKGCDVGFCCLGTTRAAAGKEGFIRVDKDYVLFNGEAARAHGCKTYNLCSSTGSNENSWFLYPRIKGEVEEALKKMTFDRLNIFRPGMIEAHHAGRTGEAFALCVLKPFIACCPASLSVPPHLIAHAMINASISSSVKNVPTPEVNTIDNRRIHHISGIKRGCCKT